MGIFSMEDRLWNEWHLERIATPCSMSWRWTACLSHASLCWFYGPSCLLGSCGVFLWLLQCILQRRTEIPKNMSLMCSVCCTGIPCGSAPLPCSLWITSARLCRNRVFIACNTKGVVQQSSTLGTDVYFGSRSFLLDIQMNPWIQLSPMNSGKFCNPTMACVSLCLDRVAAFFSTTGTELPPTPNISRRMVWCQKRLITPDI